MGLLDVKHTLSFVSWCLAKIALLFGSLVWENVRKFMLTKVDLYFLFVDNEDGIGKFNFMLKCMNYSSSIRVSYHLELYISIPLYRQYPFLPSGFMFLDVHNSCSPYLSVNL